MAPRTRPVPGASARPPWYTRATLLVPAGVLALAVVTGATRAALPFAPDGAAPTSVPAVASGDAVAGPTGPVPPGGASVDTAAAAASQAAAEAEAAAAELSAAGWTVTHVVDGDTVDVRRGDVVERVRLVGIDTPERGECGYEQAADVLADHVLGQAVVLVAGARDDRDSYDRLLRYVDRATDGLDGGRSLLDAGLAVTRYDSRDGYGAHLRQDPYMAADAAAADAAVCPGAPVADPVADPPAAPPAAPVAPVPQVDDRAGCHPAYPTVCLPVSVDTDCDQIPHRSFPALPPDPHRLDGSDGDGIGCESD